MSSPAKKRALSEIQDGQDDPATVYLVDDGDLRIHVACSSERKKRLKESDVPLVDQETLVVSSAVMRIASPVWRTMFDPQGRFMESQRSSTHGEVDFPEDDPDALLCILRIAHLQFRKIPETLNFAELLNLAIICDKYDTVAIVRPWVARWVQQTKALVCKAGCEGYLFIAWTFGDYAIYKSIAIWLVYCSTTDKDGRLLDSSGKLIGDDFPPAAVDTILEARRVSIAGLIGACSKLIEYYQSNQLVCQVKESSRVYHIAREDVRRECDTLVLGSLVRGLKGLGIWPTILPSGEYLGSVDGLIKNLRSLHCFALGEKSSSDTAHKGCKFTQKLDSEIKPFEQYIMISGVHDSHREHMEQQAQK